MLLGWTPSFGQDRGYIKRESRCPQGILVGVEDIWSTLPERLLQSFDTEVGLQGVAAAMRAHTDCTSLRWLQGGGLKIWKIMLPPILSLLF